MTGKRMPALDLAGPRLLESLGRTLMGLQLWHNVLGVLAAGDVGHHRLPYTSGKGATFLMVAQSGHHSTVFLFQVLPVSTA